LRFDKAEVYRCAPLQNFAILAGFYPGLGTVIDAIKACVLKRYANFSSKGVFFMKKKVLVLALMLVSSVILLPGESFAATAESTSMTLNNSAAPQIRVRIGGRRRGRNWNRGRHRGWENRGRTRQVRQVYWRNGRRYVRYVTVRG
jgi:hypothetical protein